MHDHDHNVVSFPRYWSDIDDALRTAMYDRGIDVKLLASYWSHTPEYQVLFIKSLAAINGTSTKGSMETVGIATAQQCVWHGVHIVVVGGAGMYSSFYNRSF